MDHILSELSIMTRPSWVALVSMAHSFIDLCKSLCYDKAVIHEKVLMNMFFFNSICIYYLLRMQLLKDKIKSDLNLSMQGGSSRPPLTSDVG